MVNRPGAGSTIATKEVATAAPDATIPAGSIRIAVVDANGSAASGAEIALGVIVLFWNLLSFMNRFRRR